MLSYSRPHQPPASRGSKLGYYRASIACVGCRKSKTRCLLTPRREQDSCLNCRRKNQPCAFLTVDKKPPDWIWSKRRQRQSTDSESGSSSQLSVSLSSADLKMVRDSTSSANTDTPSSQPYKEHNLAWDVDMQELSFAMLFPPNLGSHADPVGWVDGNSESFVPSYSMGNTDADLTLPQFPGPSPSLGLGWDINIMPPGYPYENNQYQLQTGQFNSTLDPTALALSTPHGNDGYYYFQGSGEGT